MKEQELNLQAPANCMKGACKASNIDLSCLDAYLLFGWLGSDSPRSYF